MTDLSVRLTAALADRYTLERELGAGGMATVYLAHDIRHDRKVAIKVLRPELAAVLGAERFVQEIKTTANLQHPHILPLFDSGEADSFLYYVMPYIEGETLRDKLKREKQLSIDEAIKITTEVADALDYAHRQNVIHRDIKPENILLHDGRPMVADFGIALAVSAAAGGRMTETGLSLGTPHYMSPEQATAEKEITARSDVYSLGSVLYEMLTGDPPHMGSSAQAIIMKIVTEDAQPVTKLRRSVPSNVTAAVAKALEKLPADRFASAKSFAEALTNPAFTTFTGVERRGRTGAPSRPTVLTWGLAAIAVVGGALAAWGWLRPLAHDPATERQWIGLSPAREGGMLQSMWPLALALAPDGSAIVFADTVASASLPLLIKERGSAAARGIPGTEGGGNPFFSPDGQWIGFATDRGLLKIPRAGGAAMRLSDSTRVFPTVFSSGAWLDDGTIVVAARDNGRLFQVDAEGGGERLVLDQGRITAGGIVRLAPLPQAQGVLVTICPTAPCATGEVWAVDLRRDSVAKLADGASSAWFMPGRHLLYGRADGSLFAQRLDRERLALQGAAVAILGPTATLGGIPSVAFAPSGTILYAVDAVDPFGGVATDLVWVDRDRRETVLQSGLALSGSTDLSLRLSPDGTRLALVQSTDRGPQVFIKEMPEGPVSRLTFEGANRRPVWTPDGRDVAFIGDRGKGAVALRRRADGTGSEVIVASEARAIWEVLYSPDGEWLIYRTDNTAAGRGDILARRLMGDTATRPLLATPAEETSPAISPDARWLAYTSDESGRPEIYVRPFPDVEHGRWQVSHAGGVEPHWSPDGRELFYRAVTGDLTAAQVATSPSFRITGTRPLLDARAFITASNHTAYTVSRDGRRFLFGRGAMSPSGGRLVLVQNLFTELRPLLERD